MTTVSVSEARSEFFDLVERASSGERITLVSRGLPRAMMVPVDTAPRPLLTATQAADIFEHQQMDAGAWDAIRFPGDTIGEDDLG